MMCKFVNLFIAIIFSLNAIAQEETITIIRKLYTDYNIQIENYNAEGLDFLPLKYEIKTVQNRPALGPVNVKFTYFFDEITTEDLNDEADDITTTGFLRKVVYSESMPSYTEYREFFYDEKGNLVFYYSKLTGYSCGEKRLYFEKGKIIKIKCNPIIEKDCGDEKFTEYAHISGKFTKDDHDLEDWVLKIAIYHTKAFLNMYESLH